MTPLFDLIPLPGKTVVRIITSATPEHIIKAVVAVKKVEDKR
jgi:hypothetical protein